MVKGGGGLRGGDFEGDLGDNGTGVGKGVDLKKRNSRVSKTRSNSKSKRTKKTISKARLIKKKIKKSYCPAGEIEGNPIIEIAHHFIFSERDRLVIKRPDKFGGNLDLTQEELLKMYKNRDLHPLDLKNSVADCLADILEPVRNYLKKTHK